MSFNFFKYNSNGNDFIIIDDRNKSFNLQKEVIQKICSRQFCVGADGLVLLRNSNNSDFKMKIYNSDGLEANMCGNALLCLVKFIYDNIVKKDFFLIETKASVYETFVEKDLISFKSEFPEVVKENCRIKVQNLSLNFCVIDSGVLHGVIFLENIDKIDVLRLGRQIRYSDSFLPGGINVNFCEVLNENQIKVRTYEKGVENETYCCSTGALATTLAFYKKKSIKFLTLHFKGGKVFIDIDKNGLKLTQKPNFAFRGSMKLF